MLGLLHHIPRHSAANQAQGFREEPKHVSVLVSWCTRLMDAEDSYNLATRHFVKGSVGVNAELTANPKQTHGAFVVTEDVRVSSSHCVSLPCTGL